MLIGYLAQCAKKSISAQSPLIWRCDLYFQNALFEVKVDKLYAMLLRLFILLQQCDWRFESSCTSSNAIPFMTPITLYSRRPAPARESFLWTRQINNWLCEGPLTPPDASRGDAASQGDMMEGLERAKLRADFGFFFCGWKWPPIFYGSTLPTPICGTFTFLLRVRCTVAWSKANCIYDIRLNLYAFLFVKLNAVNSTQSSWIISSGSVREVFKEERRDSSALYRNHSKLRSSKGCALRKPLTAVCYWYTITGRARLKGWARPNFRYQ